MAGVPLGTLVGNIGVMSGADVFPLEEIRRRRLQAAIAGGRQELDKAGLAQNLQLSRDQMALRRSLQGIQIGAQTEAAEKLATAGKEAAFKRELASLGAESAAEVTRETEAKAERDRQAQLRQEEREFKTRQAELAREGPAAAAKERRGLEREKFEERKRIGGEIERERQEAKRDRAVERAIVKADAEFAESPEGQTILAREKMLITERERLAGQLKLAEDTVTLASEPETRAMAEQRARQLKTDLEKVEDALEENQNEYFAGRNNVRDRLGSSALERLAAGRQAAPLPGSS